MRKNYYLILHLSPQSTADEIKSAYRLRALEIHPDLSGFGGEQFLELQEAYAVLSDPARRAVYDREAEEIPVRRGTVARPAESVIMRRRSAEPLIGAPRPVGVERISLFRSFETFLPSFDEMFDRLWSNFESMTRPKEERLESLTVDVPLSPQEAFAGGAVRMLIPSRLTCPVCRGQGSVGHYECGRCGGRGVVTVEYPVAVSYPAGLQQNYMVRLPLDRLGIHNFYLTVRFRPSEASW
jgi:molecular chaperone DnaJ